jgi:hypothetical protein
MTNHELLAMPEQLLSELAAVHDTIEDMEQKD